MQSMKKSEKESKKKEIEKMLVGTDPYELIGFGIGFLFGCGKL